nr:unnamed protein product [Callosobruchus chinensis]
MPKTVSSTGLGLRYFCPKCQQTLQNKKSLEESSSLRMWKRTSVQLRVLRQTLPPKIPIEFSYQMEQQMSEPLPRAGENLKAF